jgi:hypothetical protein
MRGGGGNVRVATTRPSSRWSDGSSMAISADQTEGNRRQRRAKAATRKATNMTSIWWAGESGSFSGAGGGTPEGIDRGVETESWWSWWLVEGKRGGSQGGGKFALLRGAKRRTKSESMFGSGNEVPTHNYVISVYLWPHPFFHSTHHTRGTPP